MMGKAVLISIRPQWCEKIASGEKTLEIRKTKPNLETPFKCYIYCTQSGVALGAWGKHGKVIGEFTCDRIFPINVFDNGSIQNCFFEHMERSCLTYEGLADYIGNRRTGHGWHISNLKIYDSPKKLSEFKGLCKVESDCCACPYYNYSKTDCDGRTIKRPPQSWCYVEEMNGGKK